MLNTFKEYTTKGFPDFIGENSENGAHRIAVEWEENGEIKEGVFILRRDTNLKLNVIVGGRVFLGIHYFARFNVIEQNNNYHLDFKSCDNITIEIDAVLSDKFDENSIFKIVKFSYEIAKIQLVKNEIIDILKQ